MIIVNDRDAVAGPRGFRGRRDTPMRTAAEMSEIRVTAVGDSGGESSILTQERFGANANYG